MILATRTKIIVALLSVAFALSVSLVYAQPGDATPTIPTSCVEDGWLFPYQYGGNSRFGDMADILIEHNTGLCGPIAHTVYVRLADDYSSDVEIGYREWGLGPQLFWAETDPVHCPVECPHDVGNSIGAHSDLSVNVASLGAPACCHVAQWQLQYALNNTESNWSTLALSQSYPTNVGMPESEVSWYGNPTAYDNHSALKYRPAGGGWVLWNQIACDHNISRNTGWSANFYSDSIWASQTGSGSCP